MSAKTLANTLTRTVKELAKPESYKDLCAIAFRRSAAEDY